ncbi:MAG: nucleotide exchange factor GrpE [Propionibacteriaceae bacterium]|jgi:molecular chaperone GrpE|nr:nucleotide exchange factor GrpE [Propionibacteriaceae bacterium]
MTDQNDAGKDFDEEIAELVDSDPEVDAPPDVVDIVEEVVETADGDLAALLAERTLDLKRLQAEYVNYKHRVDRDRAQARQRGIESVIGDLLPVLDGIDAARAHNELEDGARLLADELTKVTTKYGMVAFGEEGEAFNPYLHDALMQVDKPGYLVTSIAQVFQRGYAIGERVIRPARVAVAGPDDAAPDAASNQEVGQEEPPPGGDQE